MSLSNNHYPEEFKPFNLETLDSYDQEHSGRTVDTPPDFERFQLLIEPDRFEKKDTDVFKALYNGKKEEKEAVFEPLIKPPEAVKMKDGKPPESSLPQDDTFEVSDDEEPEETPEERGFREGHEKGIAQGLAKGEEDGYQQGFEKGRAEGLEQGKADGFETGFGEGMEDGRKEGAQQAEAEVREQAGNILASLEESLKSVDSLVPSLVEKYEDRFIDLVCRIARKVVFATIDADDEIVRPMILDALKTLVEPEQVVLKISEADYQYVEMIKDDFFEQVKSLENISVVSDPGVERGGCRIDTNTASIVSEPSARLDAIFEAVKSAGKQQ